jgi:nucleotide-binding universal stress UspA family protein
MKKTTAFQRILVAYDGSGFSRKVYDVVTDIANKYQSEVRVIVVAHPPESPENEETEAALKNARKHFQKQFGTLQSAATRLGLNPHLSIVTAPPAE